MKECPYSGKQVYSEPEWINAHVAENHYSTMCIIGSDILYVRPEGHITAATYELDIAAIEKVIEKHFHNKTFILIDDVSQNTAIDFSPQKSYTKFLKKHQHRMHAHISLAPPKLLLLAIRVAQKVHKSFQIEHVAKTYSDAMQIAQSFDRDANDGPFRQPARRAWNKHFRESIYRLKKLEDDIILETSARTFDRETSENFFEYLDSILETSYQTQPDGFFYIIDNSNFGPLPLNVKYLIGDFFTPLHNKRKIRALIFTNMNRMARTMFRLVERLFPFNAAAVADLEDALKLINKIKSSETQTQNVDKKGEYTVDEIKSSIDELLGYVGAINYDPHTVRNLAIPDTHPLKDIFRLFTLLSADFENAISENQKVRTRVLQSVKLASVGELAAGVAHEINNPLTIIRGHNYVVRQRLKQDGILTDSLRNSFDQREIAIRKIADIVNGLRTFAHPDMDERTEFNLQSAINETHSLVRAFYTKSKIDLQKNFGCDNPSLFGSQGKFQQIIMNLLSNAKDATGIGGIITIETDNVDGNAVISVSDNGCGIHEQNIDKIFDAFYTTKSAEKGTGLGLSISRSLAEEMNGELLVESKLGEGSKFFLKLSQSDSSALPHKKFEQPTLRKELTGTILVVDDEPDLCTILKHILADFGLKVETANDGFEALEFLKHQRFDYLLVDLQMPTMDGYTFIRQARSLELIHGTKLFMMTGGFTTEDAAASEPLELPLIEKPFTVDSIYDSLTSK